MTIDFEKLAVDIGEKRDEHTTPPNPIDDREASEYLPECDERGNPVDKKYELPPIEDAFGFIENETPEPAQIIQGLAHQGTKMILGGGSKSYKTWIQLDLALSLAYGLPWLGHQCVAGRVLYINLEIPKPFFQRRITKVCEAREIQQCERRLDTWNLRGYAVSYDVILPAITERIKELGYIAVFIDPIYKIYGKTDENSASEVARLLNGVEKLCVETNAMTAFGAHYSKGNQAAKESIDRISGSGTFARDPDSIISFTAHNDPNAFVVDCILRNLPPVEPFVVRWKYPLMERDDEADPTDLKQQAGGRKKEYNPIEFLKFIRERTSENPISVSEWAELAEVARPTLIGYLDGMRSGGWIITIGEGRTAKKAISDKGIAILNSL